MDLKELFQETPGFGDVCYEKWGRYPSIKTLERTDVRPGNVKTLKIDTSVNPITHDLRINYQEMRRILIEIDRKFENVFPMDGVVWMMSILCDTNDASKFSTFTFFTFRNKKKSFYSLIEIRKRNYV